MKRTMLWATILAAGFGMMLLSYYALQWTQREAMAAKRGQFRATSQTSTSPAATQTATTRAITREERAAKVAEALEDPTTRVPAGAFHLYLAGMALMLAGGSALMVRLYDFLVWRAPLAALRAPLVETRKYRLLFILLHVGYFGAMILLMEVVYAVPHVQSLLVAQVGAEIDSGEGPLGVAGRAYISGNVPLAAVTTLAVNFCVASVLSITVPSFIAPGIGALVAALRFLVLGLILAPANVAMSGAMLPHSFTVLLECEAYILASFFALLIPIYLGRAREGPSAGRRYGKAILLNLKANLWVLIVLAIAAIYEAVEVIAMRGS